MSETYYTEDETFSQVIKVFNQKTPAEIMEDAKTQSENRFLSEELVDKLKSNILVFDDRRYFRQPDKVSDKVSEKTIGIGAVIIVGIAIWYFLRRK